MLLELCVGDAAGAGFEYCPPEFVSKNNNLCYVKHPRHTEIAEGSYTDDGQMSIGVAELMLSDVDWTPLNIANKFVEVFKRDERTGYSRLFYQLLKEVQTGEELLSKIKPVSEKSGASMRAPVIGFEPNWADVTEKTRIQAQVTHNTYNGIKAAQATALMAHYFIYKKGKKEDLPRFLSNHVPAGESPCKWEEAYEGPVGALGWMSVRAAITAIMKNDSLSSILKASIAYTGDVDTVAAIALGCASHCDEIKQDLPQSLIDGLENKAYGRDYIIDLDKRLCEKYGVRTAAKV